MVLICCVFFHIIDDIKWTSSNLSPVWSCDIHPRMSQPQPSITNISLKITYLKFHWNFPGANELTCNPDLLHVSAVVAILIRSKPILPCHQELIPMCAAMNHENCYQILHVIKNKCPSVMQWIIKIVTRYLHVIRCECSSVPIECYHSEKMNPGNK